MRREIDFLIRGTNDAGKTVYLVVKKEGVEGTIVDCLIDEVNSEISLARLELIPLLPAISKRVIQMRGFN